MPDKPPRPPRPPRPPQSPQRRRKEKPPTAEGHVRVQMELSWPAPDTGADAPAREMGQSQWIKRIRHGDAEDSTCTDPYHVYTDVYEEDKAKRGRFRTCVKYSTDPVLEANVSRLYQEIIIPHLIEQYIKETGDTRMRDLLPPGRRRASEDPAGER